MGATHQYAGIVYPKEVIPENLELVALGIDTLVVEYGTKKSGGQRESNGKAGAMIMKSQLLALNEATNSIDSEAEATISGPFQNPKSRSSPILITHRFSKGMHSVIVALIHHGNVFNCGSINEVRRAIPNLNKQSKLMGLYYVNQFLKYKVVSFSNYRSKESAQNISKLQI